MGCRTHSWVVVVGVVSCLWGSPAVVHASDTEARGLFEAGRAAYDAGRFERALAHFEEAYALSPRPLLLFNMGLAHDELDHHEQALEHFDRFLDADPRSPHRPQVESRIASLKRGQALTPEAVALAHEQQRTDGPPPLYKRWYVWAGAAAAVVVVAVVVAVAAGGGSSGSGGGGSGASPTRVTGEPVMGTNGSVIYALEGP